MKSGGYNISINSGQVAADAPSTEKDPLSWVDAVQDCIVGCYIHMPCLETQKDKRIEIFRG